MCARDGGDHARRTDDERRDDRGGDAVQGDIRQRFRRAPQAVRRARPERGRVGRARHDAATARRVQGQRADGPVAVGQGE